MANKESKETVDKETVEESVEELKLRLNAIENCLKEKEGIIQQLEREINNRAK